MRLWKVGFVDNLDKPGVRTFIYLHKAPTAFAAMNDAIKTEAWKAFREVHPGASISSVEFAGNIEQT